MRKKLLVTGPDEHGSVYVYFRRRRVGGKRVITYSHPGAVNLDFDAKGRLFGIELLGVPLKVRHAKPVREPNGRNYRSVDRRS